MRRLVRAIMAVSLIAGDAAQAASLTETPSGARGATRPVVSDQARLRDLVERDAETWRRIAASICRGCGAPPPPLEITRSAPLPAPLPAREEVAAAPEARPARATLRPVSLRSAGLQPRDGARWRGPRADPAPVRLTARARRYARTAHLRALRHHRRLALLRVQRRRHALLAAERRNAAHRLKLAGLGASFLRPVEGRFGGDHRPVPLPPQRPDALCAEDRALALARIRPVSACTSLP